MEAGRRFNILFLKEADDFLGTLDAKAREKLLYNIHKSMHVLDKELFKKMDGTDIWEFRASYRGNAYRLLAFWDDETASLVVATNGFVKKTQKTPAKELQRAREIRSRYFNRKR